MNAKSKVSMQILIFLIALTFISCDEKIPGHPDFWAQSYFGQTSPYPMGWLNPKKKEYKYSVPWTVVQTKDKGYLLGGLLRTFMESNAMLFKVSSNGTVEKAVVVYDGVWKGEDRQSGVITQVLDNGDGYIAAGWVSRLSSTNIIKSNTSMWIMKLDYNGNIVWNRAHGQTSYYEDKKSTENKDIHMDGYTTSLVKTSDGGFVLGGRQLVKVNSLGKIQWSKINTIGDIKDMKATADGGLIISTIAYDENNNATVAKTDSMGNVTWTKEYHVGGLNSALGSVEVMTNESGKETGYLFGGFVKYNEDRSFDCLVIATDTKGNILWDYTYNSVMYDPANMIFSEDKIVSITKSNDGKYLLGITSEGFEEELNIENAIVVKIDNSGTIIWEKAYDVFSARLMNITTTDKGFVFTGDLSGMGDWHSLIASCDEDGNIPDHGDDIEIRDINFMITNPESYSVDVTGDAILHDIDLVTVDLHSKLMELNTDRVRR